MKKILKNGAYFTLTMILLSCNKNMVSSYNEQSNKNSYSKYEEVRETYDGKYSKSEYDELVKKLETELNVTIPAEKSIIINFDQNAPSCFIAKYSRNSNKIMTNNRIKISSKTASTFNAVDFFVYTKDAHNSKIYEKLPEFKVDSGFFYENIFTEHLNCEAFIVIKPNGEFLKYYGGDYSTEVVNFLKKN